MICKPATESTCKAKQDKIVWCEETNNATGPKSDTKRA